MLISGVARRDRHEVTADINDAISAVGGWVIDHTLFSNIAITIQCSLPSLRLHEFQRRVAEAGVKLDDDSTAKIQAMVEKSLPKPSDTTASLNVTFIHDEPDLRREIPAVPG